MVDQIQIQTRMVLNRYSNTTTIHTNLVYFSNQNHYQIFPFFLLNMKQIKLKKEIEKPIINDRIKCNG